MEENVTQQGMSSKLVSFKKRYYIDMKPDGSFRNPRDRIYSVDALDLLTFVLNSKLTTRYVPILLSNYPKLDIHNSYHYPKCPIVTQPLQIKQEDLYKHYTHYEGFFNEEGSWQCNVQLINFCGSLQFQLVFVNHGSDLQNLDIMQFGKPEWIVIQPMIKSVGKEIKITQLIVQTISPHCLGKSENWVNILKLQANLGYNAFHFPPVQQLGRSGSLYAISDQLSLNNQIFKDPHDFSVLEHIIKQMHQNLGTISFVDILLNHTSVDSEFINRMPRAMYTRKTSPSLGSAIDLDNAIIDFSMKLMNKKIPEYPKGKYIQSEDDINQICNLIPKYIFEVLRLEEYFTMDLNKIKNQFKQQIEKAEKYFAIKFVQHNNDIGMEELEQIINQNVFNVGANRYDVQINIDKVIEIISKNPQFFSLDQFDIIVEKINEQWRSKAQGYIAEALNNIKDQMRQQFLNQKQAHITENCPINYKYFRKFPNGEVAALNGWIKYDCNPLENFAEGLSFHYLRRTVQVWGDLVKLRYGANKQESPELWKHMKLYVQSMAQIFNGFRIDNAMATPLHVGEYMMRKARNVNNNLIVFAELFSGNNEVDAVFTKRMGLNALIVETIHENNSYNLLKKLEFLSKGNENIICSLEPLYEVGRKSGEKMEMLCDHMPTQLVYDQTHDNEAFILVHGITQTIPSMALNAFSNVFQGTVKGFDELYQYKVSVFNQEQYKSTIDVTESEMTQQSQDLDLIYIANDNQPSQSILNVQLVGSWDNWNQRIQCKQLMNDNQVYIGRTQVKQSGKYEYKFIVNNEWQTSCLKTINKNSNHEVDIDIKQRKQYIYNNLVIIRSHINALAQLFPDKYPKHFFWHHNYNVITIERQHVNNQKSYYVISRCGFKDVKGSQVNLRIECPGLIYKVKYIFYVEDKLEAVPKEGNYIRNFRCKSYQDFNLRNYADILYDDKKQRNSLHFFNMPPSLTVVLKCKPVQVEAVKNLNKLMKIIEGKQFYEQWLKQLKAADINYLLYSCSSEQQERNQMQLYNLPNKGDLPYAGFASLFYEIREASLFNEVNRPILKNIMEGNWLLDYLLCHLKKRETLQAITLFIEDVFNNMKLIARLMIPHYFCKFLNLFKEQINIYVQMNAMLSSIKLIKNKNNPIIFSSFFQNLLMASYQFIGDVPNEVTDKQQVTIAAGLPHFAQGWARQWGRDTFISFKGIVLIPGHFEIGKQIILQFAQCLRHGLIPNLLDDGKNPRYNSRDSSWWFIKAIKDYCEFLGKFDILNETVQMRFLSDKNIEEDQNMKKWGVKVTMKLYEIIQAIFQSHAKGIHFREWKAGLDIDKNMQNEGFNIDLQLDEQTGFIFGGNQYNCLTWMDKMGSSEKAQNKGCPATSRNGAPIEMTAILYSCLDFVQQAFILNKYPYDSVELQNKQRLTFQTWSARIVASFENFYWHQDNQIQTNSNNTLIYKDVVLCINSDEENRLRPNGLIALALSPNLFNKAHAQVYLEKVNRFLICSNSLGIKTLDPQNNDYVPFYDNENDSPDFKMAHGFSYHQGPEWVWLYGYFLQAQLKMKIMVTDQTEQLKKEYIMGYLANHKNHLIRNEWVSLPELTNANGEFCKFSCPAQAWSIATILEFCFDIDKLY